jgi:hypothetical protein
LVVPPEFVVSGCECAEIVPVGVPAETLVDVTADPVIVPRHLRDRQQMRLSTAEIPERGESTRPALAEGRAPAQVGQTEGRRAVADPVARADDGEERAVRRARHC